MKPFLSRHSIDEELLSCAKQQSLTHLYRKQELHLLLICFWDLKPLSCLIKQNGNLDEMIN
jgi:hypothetical protein